MSHNPEVKMQSEPAPAAQADIIADIARCIKATDSLTILTHQQPDGDAVGSSLGLGLALVKLGKQVQVACPDPVPNKYQFLPGAETILTAVSGRPQVVVAVDANNWSRLGALETVIQDAATTILIDHHTTNAGGADLDYIDPAAAASAVQVYHLLLALGVVPDADIATCLYCGLATDTGFFTFENTTREALRIAAELVAAGANPHQIAQQVSTRLSPAAAILRGRALASLQTAADGRLVYTTLTPRDFALAGATRADTDGIIDILKSVAGAEIVVLFKPDSSDRCQVSLRSPSLDVARIAAQLGGGGHAAAAGAEVAGSLPAVTVKVINSIQQALNGKA